MMRRLDEVRTYLGNSGAAPHDAPPGVDCGDLLQPCSLANSAQQSCQVQHLRAGLKLGVDVAAVSKECFRVLQEGYALHLRCRAATWLTRYCRRFELRGPAITRSVAIDVHLVHLEAQVFNENRSSPVVCVGPMPSTQTVGQAIQLAASALSLTLDDDDAWRPQIRRVWHRDPSAPDADWKVMEVAHVKLPLSKMQWHGHARLLLQPVATGVARCKRGVACGVWCADADVCWQRRAVQR